MKIDLLKYINNKNVIENYLKNNKGLSYQDQITNISLFTNMPLIVSAYYVAKINGECEQFYASIEKLKNFYKYDEVLNVEQFMKL